VWFKMKQRRSSLPSTHASTAEPRWPSFRGRSSVMRRDASPPQATSVEGARPPPAPARGHQHPEPRPAAPAAPLPGGRHRQAPRRGVPRRGSYPRFKPGEMGKVLDRGDGQVIIYQTLPFADLVCPACP
jgi:hypothetical protein